MIDDDWEPVRHATLWLPGGLTGFVHEHTDGRWRGVAVRATATVTEATDWAVLLAEPRLPVPVVFEVFGDTQTEAEMRLMAKAEDWA